MTLIEQIKNVFTDSAYQLYDFVEAPESCKYAACSFKLANYKMHYRKAKITPTKEGQFVVFWKRIPAGEIAPFEESDNFDFLIVEVKDASEWGYFVFSKSILIQNNIVSTEFKEGKRAFRVYPPWVIPKSKQAVTTQKWQLTCFESRIVFEKLKVGFSKAVK